MKAVILTGDEWGWEGETEEDLEGAGSEDQRGAREGEARG